MAGALLFGSPGSSALSASVFGTNAATGGSSAAASSSKTPASSAVQNGYHAAEDGGERPTTYLEPNTYDGKGKKKWVDSGRTFTAAVSPVGGELAMWVTKKVSWEPQLVYGP
jgi:nuclear pore complex protein Nup85